jgi:hypothetical protein
LSVSGNAPRRRRPPSTWDDDPRARLRYRPVVNEDQGTSLYAMAMGIFLVALIAAVSMRQLSGEDGARKVLVPLIASTVDIDLYVAETRESLRQLADVTTGNQVPLPGYPLPVTVTQAEVRTATDQQLRDAILERSWPVVWENGTSAFDITGDQSIDWLSSDGVLVFAMNRFTKQTYDYMRYAILGLLPLTALAGVGLGLRANANRRVRSLGMTCLISGLVGLGFALGASFLIGRIWSGDVFADEVAATLEMAADVPVRNYAVVAGLGAVLLVTTAILGLAKRFLPEPAPPQMVGGWVPYDATPAGAAMGIDDSGEGWAVDDEVAVAELPEAAGGTPPEQEREEDQPTEPGRASGESGRLF